MSPEPRSYGNESVIFEATPAYALLEPNTFAEIASISDDLILLFVMRDPVERMWSAAKYLLKNRVSSGAATLNDVKHFYRMQIYDSESKGFRSSAYELTFRSIQQAGLEDRMRVLFFENLGSKVEQEVLGEVLGVPPMLNFGNRVNYQEHNFPLDEELLREGIEAFSASYRWVRNRYGSRVPVTWHA